MAEDPFVGYLSKLKETTSCLVFADGKPYSLDAAGNLAVLEFDPVEVYGVVDLFASQYGLGGCRSLTEFAEMINNEDPEVIEGLQFAMYARHKKEVGEDAPELSDTPERMKAKARSGVAHKGNARSQRFSMPWGHDSEMGDFLINLGGVDHKKVREAKNKLANRQISKKEEKEKEEFFDWLYENVTPEKLRSNDFDLKGAYAKIKKYQDTLQQFNISASTIAKNK